MKLLLIALLAPALCCAAEAPDFAFGMPLEVDGREALYELQIPTRYTRRRATRPRRSPRVQRRWRAGALRIRAAAAATEGEAAAGP
jgi:hypothetical protein